MQVPRVKQSLDQSMTPSNTPQSNRYARALQSRLPYLATQNLHSNTKKGGEFKDTNLGNQFSSLRHQSGNSTAQRPFESVFHKPINEYAKSAHEQKVTDEQSRRQPHAHQSHVYRLPPLTSLPHPSAQTIAIRSGDEEIINDFKGFDERSMRDLSIDTSHKQFDFGRRVVYDRNSPNRFHHIVMPSSSQTVHKAESFKRKFLTSPSQSPYPSKYARIDHHRPYARANSANSKTSAFCPEVIDLSQDASEGTEYQIAMKLKEEIRGPRAENGSVRVSQGSSRIVDRCGKVRAIGIVDENSQWGQQQCSVPPSTRGLGIPAAPNWSGYLSDTNEEYYTGGSYNSYGSTDVEHKKALLNSHPVRHNQGPGKQTCSPDHPTQPSSTGRYPSVTLQTPEGPQYRRVNIVNRKVERGKPNVVRIPIQSRDAKAPRSILKKMGPFIAEESTDDEEYYTAAYKFPGHQPIQPATQTVGHGEQDSSIATEKFNTGLLDQSGAATSRALRCQARLQRGNCYVTSLKDTKNPSQQTQEEESSVHNNIQILSGAYIRSNKSIPRKRLSIPHVSTEVDLPKSSPVDDRLPSEAKNPRSPLIPNAIVPGGAFVSNVAPGTLEGPAPVHNPSELDSLVDSDSYYAIHSQLTNYEGSQRKCNDAKNAFKTKTINLQLMNRKMKAVKERAQAKNRAESRTIVFQRSTTSPRAISEDPFRPSAEKDLRNGTIAEAVVQLDPSSSITNLDDCSNASNSGRQCAHVPDPMKTSEDVEKGKPKQNPSKYITSFERNTRRISNSTISFSSAHGENLTLIRSGFNEPKFTGQTHKQQKIATRNIGQEYLQGALQHNQSTQDKQGNKWMSQERASIPSKLSGNFEKETQKSIRDGQQTLADGSCDIHQIHDKESPSLLKASQTLYEGLKNTCGPSRKRFESDTMASAKRKTPDPPISVNNMLENVNSISTETIRMERDNVGSLAQTQARHPSTVSDAEDHQGVPKHGEFREDFAQTAKESKGRTGIEGRIVRFRGRLRMGEITDALEQAQPSEQRLRDLESGQQQVVQKRDSEEQKNQEKAELYSGEKKQVSIDIPKRTKHASQQIRDMHRRNAQRRLNTNSETATKPGKPITITLTPANPLGASPTKSRVPPKNSKARKFSDRSVSRDGLIRKSEIASIHGRGCKPLKNNPAKPVVASIHEVRNKPESLSETSIKETEPQSITTQEFTPMKNVDPALPEANVEIPSISTAGRTTQEMTMEATARPSVPTDETLAKISEEDRLIVEWRDRSMKWQEVEELWNKRMGKTLTESGLRKRYRKAKYILGEVAMSSPTSSPEPPGFPKFLSEAENAPQLRELVNNPSQTKGIRKVLVDYSEDSDLDGSDGAVSEKQQVKPRKNAVAIDQPTCASSARMIQERVPAPISRPASLSVSVPNPEAIPQETTLARPITGGKTYNMKVLEECLEFMRGGKDTDSEAELDSEDEQENSSVISDDCCYWEYQVKRKTWAHNENEEDVLYAVCGSLSYTTLEDANIAAGEEALKERDGISIGPPTRQWIFTSHPTGMVEYNASCAVGNFRIVVDRFLRNASDGIVPTFKAGWLHKQVYDIKQKTTVRASKLDDVDDLFEDSPAENDLVTTEQFDIYTVLDEANREAGRLVLDLKTDKHSKRLDDILKRTRELQRIRAKIDDLEQMNETFREEVKVDDRKIIEVWVEERYLKGPRNI